MDALPAEVCRLHAEIKGMAPLLRFSQLADRRYVLTQDSDGNLARWDVTCAAIKDQYGKVHPPPSTQQLGQISITLRLVRVVAPSFTRALGFLSHRVGCISASKSCSSVWVEAEVRALDDQAKPQKLLACQGPFGTIRLLQSHLHTAH